MNHCVLSGKSNKTLKSYGRFVPNRYKDLSYRSKSSVNGSRESFNTKTHHTDVQIGFPYYPTKT